MAKRPKGVTLQKVELAKIHRVLFDMLSEATKNLILETYPGLTKDWENRQPVHDTYYGIIWEIKIMLANMEM